MSIFKKDFKNYFGRGAVTVIGFQNLRNGSYDAEVPKGTSASGTLKRKKKKRRSQDIKMDC